MKADFFIHGVLSAGQAYSDQRFKDYATKCYVKQEENDILIVEVANREGGGVRSYYTYLRYNNVYSKEGRPGSYFGMTLLLDDVICTDIRSLHFILENLFNTMVLGKILQYNGSGYVYLIDDFSQGNKGKSHVDQIKERFAQILGSFIHPDAYQPITNAAVSSNQQYKVHPYDITAGKTTQALKCKCKIYVSSTYPMSQMEKLNEQMNGIKNEADRMVRKTVEDANSRIQALTHERDKLAQEMQQVIKQKEALKAAAESRESRPEQPGSATQNAQTAAQINDAIAAIKNPIVELANYFRTYPKQVGSQHEEKEEKQTSRFKKIFRLKDWLPSLISVLMVIIVVAMLRFFIPTNDNSNIQEAIASLNEAIEKQNRTSTPDKSPEPGKDFVADLTNTIVEVSNLQKSPNNKIKIDLPELKAKELTSGERYTCQIKGSVTDENGKWLIIDGGNIINNNPFQVSARSGEYVVISYWVDSELLAGRIVTVK